MSPKSRWFWGTFLGGVALDQVTKILVVTFLEYRVDQISIIPGFLSIVHAQNKGAAFGMLVDYPYRFHIFGALTIGALLVCADLYRRMNDQAWFQSFAVGMMLSGVVGNAIDRAHKQSVTDFVRFYTEHPPWVAWLRANVGMSEWPAFNVADSALFVGLALFIFDAMFHEQEDDLTPDIEDPV